MEKGKIRRVKVQLSDELLKAQEEFIRDAEENEELHYSRYKELESSMGGRYICSDLFKETFQKYAESAESRTILNVAVHNSAACLSGEYFIRLAQSGKFKKCIFLTGVPGAGKSYLIQSLSIAGSLSDDVMIFEGDVSSTTIVEKMSLCEQNGIDIYVMVVNPTPELAQRNVISRRSEAGRGASPELMARIMSSLPRAIKELSERFDIELGIYNKRSNYDIDTVVGIEHIEMLNHGTYDELLKIFQELRQTMLEEIQTNTNEEVNDGNAR